MTGTESDDVLFGLDGDDVIVAGAGDAIIHGGDGADLMIGGDGRDRFVLEYEYCPCRRVTNSTGFSGMSLKVAMGTCML
jgi:hypothetical protein